MTPTNGASLVTVAHPPAASPAHLIITVDYEGDGSGFVSLEEAVLAPTKRLLTVANRHGFPVTLFVDVSEFRFLECLPDAEALGVDRVRAQLAEALEAGHDVQLHLHPQWDEAQRLHRNSFQVRMSRWRIANLASSEIETQIADGRTWLSALATSVRPDWECLAFRAGAWGIQPSAPVLRALHQHGIRIDSTVAPGRRSRSRHGHFDFRGAPVTGWWRVKEDVLSADPSGPVLEIPILTGSVSARTRLSWKLRQDHALPGYRPPRTKIGLRETLAGLPGLRTASLDPSNLDAPRMIRLTQDWRATRLPTQAPLPLVLITHNKSFGPPAERALDEFLAWAAMRPDILPATYGSWLTAAGLRD